MLGIASIVLFILALCGVVSVHVVMVIGLIWCAKELFILCYDKLFTEKAVAAEPGMGKKFMHFGLQAGLEFYSAQPITRGVHCKVVVDGTDDYLHGEGKGQGWGAAKLDALYLMGGGQYSRHESLLFDHQPAVLIDENPYAHRYCFAYTGTGRHLSVLLRIPEAHKCQHTWQLDNKPLQVTIHTLTVEEEIEAKAREDQHEREVAEMQQEELNRRALELATAAQIDSNFLDSQYQLNYASKHTSRILTTLGHEWRTEYLSLISNEPLYALVQAEYPHVLEYFAARAEVFRIAQRRAVEPVPNPRDQEPKRTLTREEWEAKIERYRQRQLDRMRVGADDRIAQMLERFESVRRLRERAEDLGLDEDQIERLEQELIGDLQDEEEEHNNGFKQL